MRNPFVINGIVPEQYFCDRQKETARLISCVKNETNLLLTSQRRMGKTQLVRHVYAQPEIAEEYYTFYVDIYSTSSLHEFVLLLGKEIYSTLVPKGRQILDRFLGVLKSLTGSFGYDPLTGLPTFDVKLGDIRMPELTLSEILDFLEQAGKPCICTVDEFQQIGTYPEKNVEALLRTHVQKMNNCRFFFAGSDRHVLENMFNSPAKPFYHSVSQLYLDRIERQTYVDFAVKLFADAGFAVDDSVVEYVYDRFEGHTYYVHQVLHDIFSVLEPDVKVTEAVVGRVIDDILAEREHAFAAQLSMLNYTQKETLISIAKEGKARGVTSVAYVKKHSLQSPSSVQFAVRTLLAQQMISYHQEGRTKVYFVADRFLELWINKLY